MNAKTGAAGPHPGSARLGTFAGVFTPSILTILGLVLFLRLGYVVGTAGLVATIVIIVVATLIAVLTSISLAVVATNMKVKGGGIYYIISRTLGLPFGGAIGIVLFFAQAISVGFYCVGFAEGVAPLLGLADNGLLTQAIAVLAVVSTFGLAWLGADWATRLQYVVMALIAGALLSFLAGAWPLWNLTTVASNLWPQTGWGHFWIAFAIFFPAVTGFTQGVNMSGDLEDPGRSIPRGTAFAVGLSFIVYLAVALICAGAIGRPSLVGDFGSMKLASAYAPMIDAGIIAATFSSALASFLGAPRILQSLANDRVFPVLRPFSQGVGPTNNPRRGIVLTAVIALAVVALGSLNLIAAIVSMFFVVTYGLLNYATWYEARGQSPSFRPSLTWYDSRMSLLGALAALGVILAIDVAAGIAATAVVFGLYQYLKRSAVAARWADGQRSYHLQIVRENLLKANARLEHPRDWRPQILAFSSDSARRERLVTFANWIEGHSGLTTVVSIIEGDAGRLARRRLQVEEEMARELRAKGLEAFPLVVVGADLDQTVRAVVQSAGIGPLAVNTVLVNWFEHRATIAGSADAHRFGSNLEATHRLGCNVMLLDAEEQEWDAILAEEAGNRVIDVWWCDTRSGRMMLVMAYLLRRNEGWQDATIRVLVGTLSKNDDDAIFEAVTAYLRDVRITSEVIVVADIENHPERIVEQSAASSIVFIELRIAGRNFHDAFGNNLTDLLPQLPAVALVMAAEAVDLAADPDRGDESDLAAARDALEDAEAKVDASRRDFERSTKKRVALRDEIADMELNGAGQTSIERKIVQLREIDAVQVEQQAAARTAEAELDAARAGAEKMGIAPDTAEPE